MGLGAEVLGEAVVGHLDPFAEEGAGVAGIDDVFDTERLGGSQGRPHRLELLEQLRSQGLGILRFGQAPPIGRFDTTLQGQLCSYDYTMLIVPDKNWGVVH